MSYDNNPYGNFYNGRGFLPIELGRPNMHKTVERSLSSLGKNKNYMRLLKEIKEARKKEPHTPISMSI